MTAPIKHTWAPPYVGCDCPPEARPGERCSQKVYRCNGAVKARSDFMRARGLDFWGDPLTSNTASKSTTT